MPSSRVNPFALSRPTVAAVREERLEANQLSAAGMLPLGLPMSVPTLLAAPSEYFTEWQQA